ncbi:hypothetical protein [Methylocella sp.]|uniref:hypothetical protein n=1 Tax=Methylocella sp. TaxID=1978226 RepID=UPI003783F234
MRPSARSIVLGGRTFTVRPLTLRQVQEIEPILLGASGGETGGHVAAALAILVVALRRDDPQAAETLGEIEATAPEAAAAMEVVLRLGGFLPAGDAAPGES